LLATNTHKKKIKKAINTYKALPAGFLDKFMKRIRPMPPEKLGNVSKKVQI
jgi:hypothetical protein